MNELGVAIAVVLFPGLVASVICDKITVHAPRWNGFKYSIYSFLFGVLSYALLQLVVSSLAWLQTQLCGSGPQDTILKVWSIVKDQKATLELNEILGDYACSRGRGNLCDSGQLQDNQQNCAASEDIAEVR
jgi:hypothetical protein